ncbi:flagellar export protein FliJ [Paenibacillus hemerocallicola]|jgi:flagellar FliJ protein|uniref:Flagellar FliJ protein n=1 Tax=Paenibacillus hemerocallicola TaxID=1172614 RepID=A0A5C4T672_9BACL|nr:flagellar export protein FliJ [Paenibacillus hemerocallicola]TNJ64295.1 flagellar export protein FliJ [Paenibacillus hemerocallicola]
MRFRYPLQKLVDLKTNEKEQAEWMLSEAVGQLQQEQQALTELEEELARVGEELAYASIHRTTISQMQLLQHYSQHLEQQIRLKTKDVDRAQANVTDKQHVLTGKMMEEKVWTKAKEKAQLQFTAIVMKKEQEELDEIALNRRVQTIVS